MNFHIPDDYVQQTQFLDNDLGLEGDDDDGNDGGGEERYEGDAVEDGGGGGVGEGPVITVSTTDWLNLAEQHGRKAACENVAALVRWRQPLL